LRKFWTPVAEIADVQPGRARPIEILGERFTYYRGEGGEPHLVGFNCAHRGTQLSTGWVEGDCLRCLYHGWKYDASGQCVEQPGEDATFAAKMRIPSYPVRAWLGFAFAYLGPGEPPSFPRLTMADTATRVETRSYVRQTNYLNARENSSDWMHVRFVHKSSFFTRGGLNREMTGFSADETDYGIRGATTYSDGKTNVHHIVLPYTIYSAVFHPIAGWVQQLIWRVPVNDAVTRNFGARLVHKTGPDLERYDEEQRRFLESAKNFPSVEHYVQAILRGDMHIDEVPQDHPELIQIQDGVTLNAQPPLNERDDHLGRSDTEIILLRKLMAREVRALTEGRPIKAWQWTDEMAVQTGV
jgi:5,5'-dehydrodivanillate O-demethylase